MQGQTRNSRSSLSVLNRCGPYDDHVKASNNSGDSPSYSHHSTNCPSPSTSDNEEIKVSAFLSQSKKIQKEKQTQKPKQKQKASSKRNLWSPEEDLRLIILVEEHGRKWAELAKMMPGKERRQIRNRYLNSLRPDINWGEWTEEEVKQLHVLHEKFENQWCYIAAQLPGRTENQVKNWFYWNERKQTQKKPKEKIITQELISKFQELELKENKSESDETISSFVEDIMLSESMEDPLGMEDSLNDFYRKVIEFNNSSEDIREETDSSREVSSPIQWSQQYDLEFDVDSYFNSEIYRIQHNDVFL